MRFVPSPPSFARSPMNPTRLRFPMRSAVSVAASLTVLCVAGLAQSQTVSLPNAGSVLGELPARPAPAPAAPLPKLGGVDLKPPMKALPEGGKAIRVQRFEITGNRVIDTTTLRAQLSEGKDEGTVQELTLAGIEEVATRLTRYYRSRGYFVARVYVPEQEVQDGVVTLRVVEGNYGRFILKNQSLVRDGIVQAMLDDVKDANVVSLDTLERAMLIINDTPGARVVRADVMPGQAVGTSDFAVETAAEPAHRGYVMADNHGSRYTGRERLSFNWDWNSPTGRGDRLSVSGLGAVNSDLLNARVAYSASLAPNGWRGEVSAGRTTYQLGNSYGSLDAQGRANVFEVAATYPIIRTEARTLGLSLSASHKDLRDEVRVVDTVTPKKTNALTAGLNLRDERVILGFDGVTQGSVSLTAGRLDIRSDSALQLDEADGGPHTDGGFGKLNLSVSRYSILPAGFGLTATLKHQTALGNKNLDSSERLSVAGSDAVMAYPSGELSGSDGTLLRLELSRALPSVLGLTHQWSVFSDVAQARALKSESYRTLSDIGLGWSASHPGGLILKAQLAYRLEGKPAQSENTGRGRLLLQAGWMF